MGYSIIKVTGMPVGKLAKTLNEDMISGRGFIYLALKGDNTPTQYDEV